MHDGMSRLLAWRPAAAILMIADEQRRRYSACPAQRGYLRQAPRRTIRQANAGNRPRTPARQAACTGTSTEAAYRDLDELAGGLDIGGVGSADDACAGGRRGPAVIYSLAAFGGTAVLAASSRAAAASTPTRSSNRLLAVGGRRAKGALVTPAGAQVSFPSSAKSRQVPRSSSRASRHALQPGRGPR